MIGELEKLQNAIGNQIKSSSSLAIADILIEKDVFENEKLGSKSTGVKIKIMIPMPIESSKYVAGPVFSKVRLSLVVERDNALAIHSPSLIYLAETVSKLLHNWRTPVSCGYNKIILDEKIPWEKDEKKSSIKINFTAQSVLE